jgi:hypothetical protein
LRERAYLHHGLEAQRLGQPRDRPPGGAIVAADRHADTAGLAMVLRRPDRVERLDHLRPRRRSRESRLTARSATSSLRVTGAEAPSPVLEFPVTEVAMDNTPPGSERAPSGAVDFPVARDVA